MTAQLTDAQRAFIERTRSAAKVTLRPDGSPHAVRVGVALIDGKLWSSGTRRRKRTEFLRRDPRATLFIFDGAWRWLTLECRVRLLEGADAPELNLRFFRVLQPGAEKLQWFGRQVDESDFLQIMRDEQRIIYEFDAQRAYGMFEEMPNAS